MLHRDPRVDGGQPKPEASARKIAADQGLTPALAPSWTGMAPGKTMGRQRHRRLMAPSFYLALPHSRGPQRRICAHLRSLADPGSEGWPRTGRSRRVKGPGAASENTAPEAVGGLSAARQERLFGALETLEMAQAEHPVDVPRTIDNASRDVVATAEID